MWHLGLLIRDNDWVRCLTVPLESSSLISMRAFSVSATNWVKYLPQPVKMSSLKSLGSITAEPPGAVPLRTKFRFGLLQLLATV